MLTQEKVINSLIEDLRALLRGSENQEHSVYSALPERVNEIEKVAKFVQLKELEVSFTDSPPTASTVFQQSGMDSLAEIATTLRTLQGIARLVHDEGFDLNKARPKVQTLVANVCGHKEFQRFNSVLADVQTKLQRRRLQVRVHKGPMVYVDSRIAVQI